MTYTELMNLKPEYDKFNALLFNSSLPKSNEIIWSLNDIEHAVAFSRTLVSPILGCTHEMSFEIKNQLDYWFTVSVMIHEMIHIWQSVTVDEDRYKMVSQEIAHDRVFTCKMKTINIVLKRMGYEEIPDLSVVYNGPALKKDYRRKGVV